MEGKFEGKLPGQYSAGVYRASVKYIGEGPFNGQEIQREFPPKQDGYSVGLSNDAFVRLELILANAGLKLIPSEEHFENLEELFYKAISNHLEEIRKALPEGIKYTPACSAGGRRD